MAEPIGLALGFVALLGPLTSGISKLRDIRKSADRAPTDLDSLLSELDFLVRLMQEAEARAPHKNDDPILGHCQASCDQVIRNLEALARAFEKKPRIGGDSKVLRLRNFRHWKEDVEAMRQSIRAAEIKLSLANSHHISVRLDEIALVNQLYLSSAQPSVPPLGSDPSSPHAASTASSNSRHASSFATSPSVAMERRKLRYRGNCLSRSCSCACHRTANTRGRFWALEYTSLELFGQTCDTESCNVTKRGGEFRFALSQFGIRWSVVIQLYIVTASGKFSLRPCLEVEPIVPYTSPGFEIIWRCRNGLISLEEAQTGLIQLRQSDRTFPTHVNPGGKSYIEELLRTPWWGDWRQKQYELLKLFMDEFQMTKGTEHTLFLSKCARWIGEGPHLELLEVLLDLGFVATEVDAQSWPEPSSPNWIAERLTPDPFFVDYIGSLCKDNQGFAAMTPLHEAVLFGSPETVGRWISRSNRDERNFLGQTPLHLAVSTPIHLNALIQSGHDLDALDSYGITPLMYAAATNQEESLMMLLDAGADLHAKDSRYRRNFIRYAAIYRHWKLILKILCWIEAFAGQRAAGSWAQFATILFQVTYPDRMESSGVSLHQFLAKCGSSNFTYDDMGKDVQDNCLLHEAKSVTDLKALLDNGFKLINHVNSAGQNPLMAAIDRCEPALVGALLDAGADIDVKDNENRTPLDYALYRLQDSIDTTWSAMETVRILLTNGADVLSRDNCRCPCSPDGCLIPVLPKGPVFYEIPSTCFPVWAMEWLTLLSEHRGIDEAKTTLISFIRRTKHEEMGMTHVCCLRQSNGIRGILSSWGRHDMCDNDSDSIIDEESEFVDILDSEMNQITDKQYETLFGYWIRQINK